MRKKYVSTTASQKTGEMERTICGFTVFKIATKLLKEFQLEPDTNQVLILEQPGGVPQTDYCVLRHSNTCFSCFPHHQTRGAVYEYMRSLTQSLFAATAQSALKNLSWTVRRPEYGHSWSWWAHWVSPAAVCLIVSTQKTRQLRNTSEGRSRKCVFLWLGDPSSDKYWLWKSQEGRTKRPNCTWSSSTAQLQHLVVAELLLLVFVSIFATSSLRESPDDRISSRPLKWKQRQL